MLYSQIKDVKVSKFILGSNPFSGFSHQGPENDWAMRHFFTGTKIKGILHEAESWESTPSSPAVFFTSSAGYGVPGRGRHAAVVCPDLP